MALLFKSGLNVDKPIILKPVSLYPSVHIL